MFYVVCVEVKMFFNTSTFGSCNDWRIPLAGYAKLMFVVHCMHCGPLH